MICLAENAYTLSSLNLILFNKRDLFYFIYLSDKQDDTGTVLNIKKLYLFNYYLACLI